MLSLRTPAMFRLSAAAIVWLSVSILGAQDGGTLRSFVGRTVSAKVTRVVDGDTVHARLASGAEITVRLDGIDAPEQGEPFSAQARNAARVLLFDKQVALRGTDVDRYGRLVARVSVDRVDSSVELLKAGLACHFTRYSSDPFLAAAQVDARTSGRGFWGLGAEQPACVRGGASSTQAPGRPSRIPPSTPRSLLSAPADVVYHGNQRSKVYHAPSCRNYNCPNCVVEFTSHDDAQAAGFRPAGDCLR